MLGQTQSSASGLLLQAIQEMRLGRAGCPYAFPSGSFSNLQWAASDAAFWPKSLLQGEFQKLTFFIYKLIPLSLPEFYFLIHSFHKHIECNYLQVSCEVLG